MPSSIAKLTLYNFRSYAAAEFALGPQTVVVGPNAAGKTNLLEALYLVASAKSFRADREREVIRWGESTARVTATTGAKRPQQLAITLTAGPRLVQKTFTVDRAKQSRRDFSRLPAVLFAADDVRLIDGAPGRRRRALDLILSQGSTEYRQAASRYARVLASRNRLLEQVQSGEAGSGELDFWDDQLAAAGQLIIDRRRDLAAAFNRELPGQYRAIAERRTAQQPLLDRLELAYQPTAPDLATELARRRSQDIAVGTTTAGPHRDDWQLLLAGRALSSFGSGGEYRSAMLAFRLAEIGWLAARHATAPILLLDDVFSELDEFRRAALLANLPDAQTIITTPEADILPGQFAAAASLIEIRPGRANV